MGLKQVLPWKLKIYPRQLGVCFVTHSSTVTKPLALGMSLLCREEERPQFSGGSEGSPAAAPNPGRGQGKGQGQEMRTLGSFQATCLLTE